VESLARRRKHPWKIAIVDYGPINRNLTVSCRDLLNVRYKEKEELGESIEKKNKTEQE
jgi:hypothetical protein